MNSRRTSLHWTRLAAAALLACALPVAAQEGDAAKSAAKDLMQRKLYKDATRVLLQEIQGLPEGEGGLLFLMLGESYYMQKLYAEARPYYTKAHRFLPEEENDNRIVSEYRLACIAHRMGLDAEAARLTAAFLKKHPTDRRGGSLLLFRMNTLARQGAGAEAEIEKLREQIGRNVRRYGSATDIAADNILTDFYLRQGGSQKAKDRYRNIVMNFQQATQEFVEQHLPVPAALERGHDKAAIQLASIALEEKEYNEAVRWLNIVRYDEEMKRRAKLLLAQVAYEQSDFRRAERYLMGNDFIQTVPSGALRSDMYLLLGFCAKRARHPSMQKVAEYFEKVEPGTPAYWQAQMGLGDTYERWRKLDKAIAAYENARKSAKYEPVALANLGRMYMTQGEKAPGDAARAEAYEKAAARFERLTTKYPNSREAKDSNPAIQKLIELGYEVKLAVTDAAVAQTWEKTVAAGPGSAEAARALINLARLHHKVVIDDRTRAVTKLPDYAACAHAASRLLDAKVYKGAELQADTWKNMRAEAFYYRGYAHMASATKSVPPGKSDRPPKYVANANMQQAIADLESARENADPKQIDLVKNIELGLLEAMFKSGDEATRERARAQFEELSAVYGGEERFQALAYDLAKWFQDRKQYAEAAREYRGIADRSQNLPQDDLMRLLYLSGQLYSKAAFDASESVDVARYALEIYPKHVFKTASLLDTHKPFQLRITLPAGTAELSGEEALRLVSKASRIPFTWSRAGGDSSVAAALKRKRVTFDTLTGTVKSFLEKILDVEHHRLDFDIGVTGMSPTVNITAEDREDPELVDVVQPIEIIDDRHAVIRHAPMARPYGAWSSVHSGETMFFHVIEHAEEVTDSTILWAPGVKREDVLATEFPAAPGIAPGQDVSCARMLAALLEPLDLRAKIVRRDLAMTLYDRAKDAFNEVRRIQPKSSYGERSLFTLALNFFHQKDHERMKIVLTEYLKLFDSPSYAHYHEACFWVGWVFEHEKRYRDACRFYNRAVEETLVLFSPAAGEPAPPCASLKETLGYDTAYALEETYSGALTDYSLAQDLPDFVQLHCGISLSIDPGLLESNLVFTTDMYAEAYIYDILCDVLDRHALSFRAENSNRKISEKAYFRLARSYQKDGLPRQALASCRVLLDRYPDTRRRRDAVKLQLEIYKALKDYRNVLATLDLLREELEAEGKGYKIEFEIGWVYFDLCRYDDAVKHFKTALAGAKDPRERRHIRDGYARALYVKGDFEEALNQYRELVNGETQALRAFVYEMMAWYLERATGAVRSDRLPEGPSRLMTGYEALDENQRRRVTQDSLAKVTWVYYVAGLLDLKRGEALPALEKLNAAGNSPDDWMAANAMYEVARIHMAAERYREAVEAIEYLLFATKSAEAEVKAAFALGQCHRALGKSEPARNRFEQILERYPDSPYAERAAAELKEMEEAATTAEKEKEGE